MSLKTRATIAINTTAVFAVFCGSPLTQQIEITAKPLDTKRSGLSYLSEDFSIAMVIHPRRIFASRSGVGIAKEELFAYVKRSSGLELQNVEQVIMALGFPKPDPKIRRSSENNGVVVRFSEPVDKKAIVERIAPTAKKQEIDGHVYYRAPRSGKSVCFPNDRTAVIAPGRLLDRMMAVKKEDSPLVRQLRRTSFDADAVVVFFVPPLRSRIAEPFKNSPPSDVFAPLLKIPDHIETATMTLNLSSRVPVWLELQSKTVKSAVELEGLSDKAIGIAKAFFAALPDQDNPHRDRKALLDGLDELISNIHVRRKDNRVLVSASQLKNRDGFSKVVGIMVRGTLESARRNASMSNLKYVVLALSNYAEDHKGKLPLAVFPLRKGKPSASWRVHLLPYLEEKELYKQYNFDEPWDSKHNKKLLAKIPKVYGPSSDGKTRIVAPVGNLTIFGATEPVLLSDLNSGGNNTIAVVEVAPEKAVPWTYPLDMPYDPKRPLAGFGKIDRYILAAFCNGRIEFIHKSTDADFLRMMFDYTSVLNEADGTFRFDDDEDDEDK